MSEINRSVWIGPSMLSADFLRLGEELSELAAADADYLHFDVMDGRFVPNISIGLPILEAIRPATKLPIDVHLMIVEPERWITRFCVAGADRITVHVEATAHLDRVIQQIADAGKMPGVSINPATPISTIEEVLPYVGQVLVMTVNPGFGGQSFISTTLDKIARVRDLIERVNPACRLEVDGGINVDTIANVVAAGADTVVAGTAVFNDEATIAQNIRSLRSRLA